MMEPIKLWLDSYNDIYSDFDSRQFEKRRISEDFIEELRRALKDNKAKTDLLVLYLPADKRNAGNEEIIAKHLQQFFESKFDYALEKYRLKKLNGFKLLAFGMLSMVFHAWIDQSIQQRFILTAAKVLLEPAGWFMIWVGMDYLFYEAKSLKKEMTFFSILKSSNLKFETDK